MNNKSEIVRKILGDDKRKSDRITIPLKIFYSMPDDIHWKGQGSPVNISGHGLKFKLADNLKKHTEIKIKLIFPEPSYEPIICFGEVVWSKKESDDKYEIGVMFTQMEISDRRRYVEYFANKILLQNLPDKVTK